MLWTWLNTSQVNKRLFISVTVNQVVVPALFDDCGAYWIHNDKLRNIHGIIEDVLFSVSLKRKLCLTKLWYYHSPQMN